jgi:hypothetical protein
MKLLETKYIKIEEKEYPLKKSARAYLKFEEISGHAIDRFDSSTKDSLNFLYACFWGGGSRISFDEFLELIDNENITDLIHKFTTAMSEGDVLTEKKQRAR